MCKTNTAAHASEKTLCSKMGWYVLFTRVNQGDHVTEGVFSDAKRRRISPRCLNALQISTGTCHRRCSLIYMKIWVGNDAWTLLEYQWEYVPEGVLWHIWRYGVATMHRTSRISGLFKESYKKRALCEENPINLGILRIVSSPSRVMVSFLTRMNHMRDVKEGVVWGL